jgi:tetratricopeptide (TPR) repeat protein
VRKVRRKPRRRTRKTYWVLLLLVVGAFLIAWWIYPGYYSSSPRFKSMLLQKNDEVLMVLNGDTLELHPKDRVKILDISTTITFNVGVRVFAGGLDLPALSYEKLSMASLLPRDATEGEQRFKVQVKHFNKDIGFIHIVVRPFVEDWLDKAERVIEPARKIEVLEEALKFAPQEKRIQTRLLEEYKSQRKWQEAVQLLESLAREKPELQVLEDLVEGYEALNQAGGILSSLKRLVQLQPEDARLRLRYASALEKAKRTKEAVAEYEEALKGVEKGEQFTILQTIGYLYSQAGETEKAIQAYTGAFEINRNDPDLCYNLSSLYEKAGDQEKSDFYLGEAIRLKPGDLEGRMRLAMHLFGRGQVDEADKHLTELLRKSPDSMNALLLMSKVAEKKKDTRKLREVYNRIMALEPGNSTVMYNLGILAYESGDFQAALPHLERYGRAHPQEGEVQGVLFEIYKRQKKDELAFKTAQNLIALDPKNAPPYSFIFEYLFNRGEHGKIIEVAESGLKSLPDHLDMRNYLVLSYLKTGKEDLALEQMQQILRLTPRDMDLLLQIARLQEKKGLNAEAMATYRKVLNIAPDHEEAGEAYLRLRMGGLPQQ